MLSIVKQIQIPDSMVNKEAVVNGVLQRLSIVGLWFLIVKYDILIYLSIQNHLYYLKIGSVFEITLPSSKTKLSVSGW